MTRPSRILGMLVMRNEADRYLKACLNHNLQVLDETFVYDDQSDDDSTEIALNAGCKLEVRPDRVPSFLEHEGKFRAAAWHAFEKACSPRPGDWVLAFDADEFLVSTKTSIPLREAVDVTIRSANRDGHGSVLLPVPEVFAYAHGVAQVRTDGLWGTIAGTRLFAYKRNAKFRDKAMGCGAEPTYVATSGIHRSNPAQLHLMHFGYAVWEDRMAKFDRYSKLVDHGHNDSHIQSIATAPALKPWQGPLPELQVE